MSESVIESIKLRWRSAALACLAALVVLTGCTLTNVPPTATPAPTAIPLLLPTTPPILQPGTLITPSFGIGISSNPNCALTPATWVPYTVLNGDSLGALSVAVDTPVADLLTSNCLENADSLFVDQVIYLPRLP